ncbi:hypothetical protein CR513_26992, partial [Mucuna pruriens]
MEMLSMQGSSRTKKNTEAANKNNMEEMEVDGGGRNGLTTSSKNYKSSKIRNEHHGCLMRIKSYVQFLQQEGISLSLPDLQTRHIASQCPNKRTIVMMQDGNVESESSCEESSSLSDVESFSDSSHYEGVPIIVRRLMNA